MSKTKGILIPDGTSELTVFQGRKVRSVKLDGEWWYSVTDIIEVLTDSPRPRKYWNALKATLKKEGSQLSHSLGQLKMKADDGKERETDVLKVEDVLRLIQSVPSPKAEPFKKWLAKVGYERLRENQDPELTVKRAMLQYHAKGYDEEWIKVRINNIIGRKELESEWHDRGIKRGFEFALLTDAISVATFDIKTSEHKKLKGLGKNHSLRDNMTGFELIFTSLAELSTTKIAKKRDARGFSENKLAAEAGGKIAGDARKNLVNLLYPLKITCLKKAGRSRIQSCLQGSMDL